MSSESLKSPCAPSAPVQTRLDGFVARVLASFFFARWHARRHLPRRSSSSLVLVLAAAGCESAPDAHIPMFSDGGLLRQGAALSREQLLVFEGFFQVDAGASLFGPDASIRTSAGTVSVLTDENAGFSLLGAACLPDERVVLEGYWQYPTRAEAGLVRLFVEPVESAQALCNGAVSLASQALTLVGHFGYGDEFPGNPLALGWSRELKPWRGRFLTVAHHGACENTDHCGVSPNSIETVRLAERTGSNAIELDVRVTRDGVPILFHDPMLSSSLVEGLFCNGSVRDLSLAELRGSCTLRYGERIPTVREAISAVIEETELEGLYLDIKVPDAVLPTARVVSAALTELRARNGNDEPSDDRRVGIVIAAPNEDVLAAWRSAKATLIAEGREVPACLVEYDPDVVLEEGCVAWGPTWTEGPRVEDVEKLRTQGALTVFWTINQSDFIDEFLQRARPDGIITSRSALLFHRYQKVGTPPQAAGEAP